jgi:hypothetical protein
VVINKNQSINLSVSARKISQYCSFDATTTRSNNEEPKVTGYRLIDVELLNELFQQMPCKFCGECSLNLEDDARKSTVNRRRPPSINRGKKKGCASHFRLHCGKCSCVYTFFTSKKVKHFFDVNRRFVYTIRSTG